ncbi:MAG TPA: glycosyltransferase N-terminal domain-containing protein, partial [Chitinophagales bacterium]|nr:glycosyltransferase N-terminal domain-containing protein [Chitinophagales bacterium]
MAHRFIYDFALILYFLAANVISSFSSKAQKWLQGRKRVWQELEKLQASKKRIWFHCASLGEYEQALPLMEKFSDRTRNGIQDFEIIVTFFSPSGYEIVKKKKPDVRVFYLP